MKPMDEDAAAMLDANSRAIWAAAISSVADLLDAREINLDLAGIPTEEPNSLEIILTTYERSPALNHILDGLSGAGYGSWTLHAPIGGPPVGASIVRVDRDQAPTTGIVLIRVGRGGSDETPNGGTP